MKRAFLAIAALGLAACGGVDETGVEWDDVVESEASVQEQDATFDLVYSEKLPNGNTVEFMELSAEPGMFLIVESGLGERRPASKRTTPLS